MAAWVCMSQGAGSLMTHPFSQPNHPNEDAGRCICLILFSISVPLICFTNVVEFLHSVCFTACTQSCFVWIPHLVLNLRPSSYSLELPVTIVNLTFLIIIFEFYIWSNFLLSQLLYLLYRRFELPDEMWFSFQHCLKKVYNLLLLL